MPFALTIIGLLLIITGFQNTYQQFGAQVAKDFTGKNNFTYWVIAIGIVGAIGYAKPLQGFSRAFMALIIIVIFLSKSNKGFFTSFNSAISSGTSKADSIIGAPLPSGGSGGGGDSGAGVGDLVKTAGTVAEVAALF